MWNAGSRLFSKSSWKWFSDLLSLKKSLQFAYLCALMHLHSMQNEPSLFTDLRKPKICLSNASWQLWLGAITGQTPTFHLACTVLEVAQHFPCVHLFQIPSQSFAHANTLCIWQSQASGTGETGIALIYQLQHLSTSLNCCIFTNKWQQMDSCNFQDTWEKDPVLSFLSNLPYFLKITNNRSCKKNPEAN